MLGVEHIYAGLLVRTLAHDHVNTDIGLVTWVQLERAVASRVTPLRACGNVSISDCLAQLVG